ncbi:AAA family ATPase|uniref:ExeA family protein n=1 Tax=Noviherbaspirillum sp. L7-7A TaxID=2850560 RepID=UPI001C2C81F6|nr:AAA family ATPase [Noviherbaspirillum sp. L7-7A]MBV0878137.1 AAA family ATPase [Noviherbaspirillum sp. L7-7A]
MYTGHFGLREPPFGITPDTSFFFGCRSYQEALNTLLIAAQNGEGFIKITGEVGTGKTLLCRKFMATLDAGFYTAYIPNPALEPRALIMALAEELEIVLEPGIEQHQLIKQINLRLLDLAREDRRVLLCIDEAQAMPVESLEALRLLTNLETEKRKLLQIVMFGQPELDRKLEINEIRQLKQRITFQYRLSPLDRDELQFYLSHRLSVAGYAGGRLFGPGAVRALHRASSGYPRLVNILGHKALMLAYGEGRQQVGTRHVQAAAGDTGSVAKPRRAWLYATVPLIFAALCGAGWMFLQ